ncbi:mucin-binding protein, partial [Bartonella sp. CL63NXGY]|uniref:mucin-binding protein n=1 Tax=Bartonella sp. CL63NXGY TaxID=3243538 RepID=UPI0035D122CF
TINKGKVTFNYTQLGHKVKVDVINAISGASIGTTTLTVPTNEVLKPMNFINTTMTNKGFIPVTQAAFANDYAANKAFLGLYGQDDYIVRAMNDFDADPVLKFYVQPAETNITDQAKLSKKVTRTIHETFPHSVVIDGKPVDTRATTQTVEFTRTGKHNEATGQDTFTDWVLTVNGEKHPGATGTWSQFMPQPIDGYTPMIDHQAGTEVPEVKNITANDKDVTVNVTYQANAQSMQI